MSHNIRYQKDQVYPIREDTLLLLESALENVHQGNRVLDVGTGSGCIAEELNKITGHVIGTDINPHSVRVARDKGIMVVRTDLMAGLKGPFDMIVFNPPYLPTTTEDRFPDWLERALDGGLTGRDVIRRFAEDVGRVLAEGGKVLLLASSLTGVEEVKSLFITHKFSCDIVRHLEIDGEILFVYRIQRKSVRVNHS